jgi:hypothetical protein
MTTTANSSGTNGLLRQAVHDRPEALADLFARQRERLRMMVRLRLDRRVRARLDSSAVLDLVYRAARDRVGEYVANPSQPVFLWLRGLTGGRHVAGSVQVLAATQRRQKPHFPVCG